jgi:hypothetical protein
MMVFMALILIFSFILIFNFLILIEKIRYLQLTYALNNRELKRIAGNIIFEMITSLLAVLCILLFLFYKFAKLEVFLFWGTGYWQMISLIMIGAVFILLCLSTWKHCRRIAIQDYCG